MIIGFAGKAASGKTTAAHHLAPLRSRETLIIPLAKVLRDEVEGFLRAAGADPYVPLLYGDQDDKVQIFYLDQSRALLHCPAWADFIRMHSEIQDRSGQTALSVRRILQWWGTEYRRAQDPDYWTKAWEKKASGYDPAGTDILVDDVRFMNELDTIKALGGVVIKIDRPGFAAAGDHASETSLDAYTDWDEVILNVGTLDEFKEKVARLADCWSSSS